MSTEFIMHGDVPKIVVMYEVCLVIITCSSFYAFIQNNWRARLRTKHTWSLFLQINFNVKVKVLTFKDGCLQKSIHWTVVVVSAPQHHGRMGQEPQLPQLQKGQDGRHALPGPEDQGGLPLPLLSPGRLWAPGHHHGRQASTVQTHQVSTSDHMHTLFLTILCFLSTQVKWFWNACLHRFLIYLNMISFSFFLCAACVEHAWPMKRSLDFSSLHFFFCSWKCLACLVVSYLFILFTRNSRSWVRQPDPVCVFREGSKPCLMCNKYSYCNLCVCVNEQTCVYPWLAVNFRCITGPVWGLGIFFSRGVHIWTKLDTNWGSNPEHFNWETNILTNICQFVIVI